MKLPHSLLLAIAAGVALCATGLSAKDVAPAARPAKLTDDELLTLVQQRTFQYFWDGAEPVSGMARDRFHVDGDYPDNDKDVVAVGGSGFGVMSILIGIERHFITREQGYERLRHIVDFLAKADRFHGAWPHWLLPNGKARGFSEEDDAADTVETSYLVEGLLTVRQYFKDGNAEEKKLAADIDALWRGVEYDWFTHGGQHVLYWHWSPKFGWKMNFPVEGYNECLILYVLAASSPTHTVPASVYHDGWARGGAIKTNAEEFGYKIPLKHNANAVTGPLFWAHYSYVGLNPRGLKDRYADYWEHNRNHTLINYTWCVKNPKHYQGYGANSWGLTASYSARVGYAAHAPDAENDLGTISPTAAVSSIPYTPAESLAAIRHFYFDLGDKLFGPYGFYDAFSVQYGYYPQRYLAIDQGPEIVMIENYRTGMLWKLFMSCPEVQAGLTKLGFTYPKPQ